MAGQYNTTYYMENRTNHGTHDPLDKYYQMKFFQQWDLFAEYHAKYLLFENMIVRVLSEEYGIRTTALKILASIYLIQTSEVINTGVTTVDLKRVRFFSKGINPGKYLPDLAKRGLIFRQGNKPIRYSLTMKGLELTKKYSDYFFDQVRIFEKRIGDIENA